MFENLLKLVKEHAGDAVVKNPAIPNEKNDAVINEAAGGIMDHLKSLSGSGGMDKIMGMLKGDRVEDNSEVANLSSNVAGKLMNKFGLTADQASGVAKNLIPVVMSQLAKKTNDPNDKSFDLKGILGSLNSVSTGGLGGIMGLVKKFFK